MKAVLLVGGFGTRLRPLTLDLPKQMLPVGPITMLERVVRRLGESGVTDVVLSLGYRPEPFKELYPDAMCAGVRLQYAIEPEPLDTAGAIAFAAREAGIDETFFAFNGDVLCDADLVGQMERHRSFGGDATIGLTPVDDPSRFGVVPIDEQNRVIDFVEKPEPGTAPSNWINAGLYVLEPSVLDLIEPGARVSIEREVFPALAGDGRLFAVEHEDYWLDAGTPDAYLQAHFDILDGRRRERENGVHSEAEVAESATIERSFVGAGSVIGEGAVVRNAVVMNDCRIAAGATIDGSIIAAGASVDAGVSVTDLSVVGFGRNVAQSLAGERVPGPDEW